LEKDDFFKEMVNNKIV